MVKLRKLTIETEGSAAPREIDAKEGCGGLGTEGNMGSRESQEAPTQGTTPLLLGRRFQMLSCSQVIAADQLVWGRVSWGSRWQACLGGPVSQTAENYEKQPLALGPRPSPTYARG